MNDSMICVRMSIPQVVQLLRREQFHVAGLHSDKSQETRFKITDAMRKGNVIVMVSLKPLLVL